MSNSRVYSTDESESEIVHKMVTQMYTNRLKDTKDEERMISVLK